MIRVKCCGSKQRAINYIVEPMKNATLSIMAVLNPCSICGEVIVLIDSLMPSGEREIITKKGDEALKLFEKIKDAGRIICQLKTNPNAGHAGWYLYYYDKGKKLKCYSNLSTLKLGLSEPFQELPQADSVRVL